MKFELLVSTMNDSKEIIDRMNIKSDAIIINQTNFNSYEEIILDNGKKVKIYNNIDRGLSVSRNMAIDYSEADICLFADDDLHYSENYENLILKAYEDNPDADIIAFRVDSTNPHRPMNRLKEGKVNRVMSMKISSVQISFKRKIFSDEDLYLLDYFGAGSKIFNNGEENIFMYKAIKKGLTVKYVDKKIGVVNHAESTWFGVNDEQELITKGAIFYTMSEYLYPIYNLQFALRKHNEFKDEFTRIEMLKYLFKGSKEGKIKLEEYKNKRK